MSNPVFKSPKYTAQTASQYKANIDASMAANGNDFINLGFSLSSGTLTVHAAQGTSLATSPGFVRFPDQTNPGYYKYISVDANVTLNDDAYSGTSDLTGNLFGFPTGVAVTTDVDFYLYAVPSDDEASVAFMLSRVPDAVVSPDQSIIGAPDDAVADTKLSFFAFDALDETLYDANPCVRIGQLRMRMSASDDWTIQALANATDGTQQLRPKEFEEWEYITSQTASASAQLDLVLNNQYEDFKVVFTRVLPATDNVGLYMRTSTDAGSSFTSSAGAYSYSNVGVSCAGTSLNQNSNSATFVSVTGAVNIGNATGEGVSGELKIYRSYLSAHHTFVEGYVTYLDNSATATICGNSTTGDRRASEVNNAIRFYFNSGNIASGTITLYGRKGLRSA